MSVALKIAGAFFEAIGLFLVALQIAMLEKSVGQQPLPVRLYTRFIRRLFARSRNQTVWVSGSSVSAGGRVSASVTVRPGPIAEDSSTTDRVSRLERYVERINADLIEFRQAAKQQTIAAEHRVREQVDHVRADLAHDRHEHRERQQESVRLQWTGTGIFMLGVALSLAGDL